MIPCDKCQGDRQVCACVYLPEEVYDETRPQFDDGRAFCVECHQPIWAGETLVACNACQLVHQGCFSRWAKNNYVVLKVLKRRSRLKGIGSEI